MCEQSNLTNIIWYPCSIGYAKAKKNLNKVTTQCVGCGKALCQKHKLATCRCCANSAKSRNEPREEEDAWMRD